MLHLFRKIITQIKAEPPDIETDQFRKDWELARSHAANSRERAEIDAIFTRHSGTSD